MPIPGSDAPTGASADPDVSLGPLSIAEVVTEPEVIASVPLDAIAVGQTSTVGLRVVGYSTDPAVLALVSEWIVDVVRGVAGLDVLGSPREEPIASQRLVSLSGWVGTLSVAADGTSLNVAALAPTEPSYWRVLAWLGPRLPLSDSTDTTPPNITAFVLDQTPSNGVVTVEALAADEAVLWYLSQDPVLPGSPTWGAAPATVTCAGTGLQTWYAWAQNAALLVSTRVTRTTTVPVPADPPPTITAFELDQTPSNGVVTVEALAADEAVLWYLSQDPVLPGSPAWGAAPATVTCAGTGLQTWYAWAQDAALQVSARVTRTTTVPVGDVTYFVDTFDRANGPVGNNWVAVNSAVGVIDSNDLVRTDSGDFRQLQHNNGGTFPSDYYVTFDFPAGTQGFWFGIAGRIAGDGTGIQLLWRTESAADLFTMGSGAIGPDQQSLTPVVVGIIPASWASGPCSLTLRFNGDAGTVYFNGVAYATFDASRNSGVAGTSIASIGEGQNRRYTRVRVTNFLPTYP